MQINDLLIILLNFISSMTILKCTFQFVVALSVSISFQCLLQFFIHFIPQILVSLIASTEHGLLIQDTRTMNQEFVSLLAVDTPNYIVLSKLSNQQVKILNEHLGLDRRY